MMINKINIDKMLTPTIVGNHFVAYFMFKYQCGYTLK